MPERTLRVMSVGIFPALLVAFAAIYALDLGMYRQLLREDGPVENFTAAFLFLSAILSLLLAVKIRRRFRYYHWFYVLFSLFTAFGAMEEISWGQRIFGFDSPEFFKKYAVQEEINIHNVIEKRTRIKTREAAPVLVLAYGVGLPLWTRKSARVRSFLERTRIWIPPPILSAGFVLSSVLMLDYPTRLEEELGELFLGIGLALFMLWEMARLEERTRQEPGSGGG